MTLSIKAPWPQLRLTHQNPEESQHPMPYEAFTADSEAHSSLRPTVPGCAPAWGWRCTHQKTMDVEEWKDWPEDSRERIISWGRGHSSALMLKTMGYFKGYRLEWCDKVGPPGRWCYTWIGKGPAEKQKGWSRLEVQLSWQSGAQPWSWTSSAT